MATVERPLVVLLDGLNQLGIDHRADRLNWLPRTLPANVHLVLSTLSDHPTFDVLQMMTSWLPEFSVDGLVDGSDELDCFVEIPSLNHDVNVALVRQWLQDSGRDLTKQQLEIVNKALKNCSLPLYTSLVFEEVSIDRSRFSLFTIQKVNQYELTVEIIVALHSFDELQHYFISIFIDMHVLNCFIYVCARYNGYKSVH